MLVVDTSVGKIYGTGTLEQNFQFQFQCSSDFFLEHQWNTGTTRTAGKTGTTGNNNEALEPTTGTTGKTGTTENKWNH